MSQGTGTKGEVRVLICEDHRFLADALASLLSQGGHGSVVCPPVQTGEAALEAAVEHCPDVVVMDINLSGSMSGLEATRAIKERCPESNVVVLTAHEEEDVLVPAVEAGASALVQKSSSLDEVLDAIDKVAAGQVVLDRAKLDRLMRAVSERREGSREAASLLDQLTQRETEILQLAAQGLSTGAIAGRLVISPHTVQTHVRHILAKLRVNSKLQAVSFAAEHGRISLP